MCAYLPKGFGNALQKQHCLNLSKTGKKKNLKKMKNGQTSENTVLMVCVCVGVSGDVIIFLIFFFCWENSNY